MPGFLKMMLQLLFGVPAALAHSAYLLGAWCSMGVQVRAAVMQILALVLAHTGIVPPETGIGKGCAPPPWKTVLRYVQDHLLGAILWA